MKPLSILFLLVTLALIASSCGNAPAQVVLCGSVVDCIADQICKDGVCRQPECKADSDCGSGMVCGIGECQNKKFVSCGSTGSNRCKDPKTVQECLDDGRWKEIRCASDEECKNDTCQLKVACTANERKCTGNSALICKVDGSGWERVNCSSDEECLNGECKKKTCTSPGKKVCKDTKTAQECLSDGHWKEIRCASDEECNNGDCKVKLCSPQGSKRCVDSGTVQECLDDGSWKEIRCAAHEECRNNTCQLKVACTANEKKCDNNTALKCKADGSGWERTNCSSDEECINGECKKKECSSPGMKLCKDSTTVQECQSDNRWREIRCASDEECNNGTCKKKACSPVGSKLCVTMSAMKECQSSGAWQEIRCASDEECKGGQCAKVQTCTNKCTENARQCITITQGEGYQVCTKQSDGCTDWGAISYCGATEECKVGKCVPKYPNCKVDTDCLSGEYCYLSSMTCKKNPTSITLLIVSAYINVATSSGDNWDGVGPVDPASIKKVADELAKTGNPYAIAGAVALVLAGFANSAFDPPDPYGTATIVAGVPPGVPSVQLPEVADTFTPSWTGKGWINVPFNTNLQVSVSLTDSDLVNDDPIGTAKFGYSDILQALKLGQIHQIQVNKQTNNTILFIGISVTP